ncbi:ATPase [Nocardia sp. ET3-3]|uniref:ATPase n=1 Tax=Nocardia terrae TaxID=2675851 RepID=A0A7K1V4K9_9NOCA|nr:BadF/BadG/BcrA/BcrD ATPase family protein [Nocardia terrae]MVU81422.1 ATPase [Nocardia terrae]
MTSCVLAIDLGKTGCRGSLRVGGKPTRCAEVAGAPGLANAGGVAAAEQAILAVVDRIAPATAFALSVGAAGAAAAPDAAALLAGRLAEHSGADAVAVASDAVTAHAGALGGSSGVVLAAGTGAVATAVDDRGRFTRVDGWGPLLGDEGSGGWIGLEGLRAALRSHDGRGPRTALVDAVGERYGIAVHELPNLLGRQDNPASTAARFAPAVAAAATTDETAAAIMTAAGHALGRSVLAAVEQSGLRPPVPCAITGGLVNLGAALLDPLDRAIDGVVDRRAPLGRPIDGAALLATDTATALEGLVIRVF